MPRPRPANIITADARLIKGKWRAVYTDTIVPVVYLTGETADGGGMELKSPLLQLVQQINRAARDNKPVLEYPRVYVKPFTPPEP